METSEKDRRLAPRERHLDILGSKLWRVDIPFVAVPITSAGQSGTSIFMAVIDDDVNDIGEQPARKWRYRAP